jgi:superfamily I DNA/RNA helicase
MSRLAVSTDFLRDFDRLESRMKRKLEEIVHKFAQLTPEELRRDKGLNLEPYKGSADPKARTVRFDRNHRGIVMDIGDGETFVLTRVLPHEAAERWMANNTFKVNAATGAPELIDLGAITSKANQITDTSSGGEAKRLFADRRERDFTNLGVEAELVPALMMLTSQDQLSGLIGHFPEGQAEAIIALSGDDTVDDIYKALAGAIHGEVDTDDIVAALETPAAKAQFYVVEGQDELQKMLSQPLAMWRVFLHPSQRHLAYRDSYSGPARVTGGAGTGKTVVAMHRAKALADRIERPVGKPILFTTFSRNLAQAIEADLRSLGGSDLLDVVDVLNVDQLAYRVVQEAEGKAPSVADRKYCRKLAEQVVLDRGIVDEFSGEFLINEWEQVVLANDCRSRADYFAVSRTGRGIPLSRRKRAEVWKAIEDFERALNEAGARTHPQLAAAAAGYLALRNIKPYQHVVVDEAQDLHEMQWRLLRALVAEGPDDLFIVGDSHQRIYDRRSSLSKVGIKVVGRSSKLKLNYRTTHEIMSWSLAMLGEADTSADQPGPGFDDLDGGSDTHTFAGYHSLRSGPEPELGGFTTAAEHDEAVVARVRAWIDEGVDPIEIGIAARTNKSLDRVSAALTGQGVTVCRLPQKDLPNKEGVRLGTMHRMKGLEYQRVIVVDADDAKVPLEWTMTDRDSDPVQHAVDLEMEKCRLYVAATRARDGLYITWTGTPSRFLGP